MRTMRRTNAPLGIASLGRFHPHRLYLRSASATFTTLRRFQTSRAYIYGASRASDSAKLCEYSMRVSYGRIRRMLTAWAQTHPVRASLSRPLFLPVRDSGSDNSPTALIHPPCIYETRRLPRGKRTLPANTPLINTRHPPRLDREYPPPEYPPWTRLRSAE